MSQQDEELETGQAKPTMRELVERMVKRYATEHTFRPEDLRRVVGDPKVGVGATLSSHYTLESMLKKTA